MPLTSGIQQPFFDATLGVKRQTKLESTSGPLFPSLTQTECMSGWVTVNSGVIVGGYGAYVELFASTARDSIWVALQFRSNALGFLNQNLESGIDLALGAAGSEVPFWIGLAQGLQGALTPPGAGTVPMIYGGHEIPSGSRVSVRVFDDEAAARVYVGNCQLLAR